MLFNSPGFLFVFLPITLVVFYYVRQTFSNQLAYSFLGGASILFYGWWEPWYTVILLVSIMGNYAFHVLIVGRHAKGLNTRWVLISGVMLNLSMLGWYKYFTFLLINSNEYLGTDYQVLTIVLPIGISFFTFQQIALLVDSSSPTMRRYSFSSYFVFISFFPQLIAGPIVRHDDLIPQFANKEPPITEYFTIGLSILIIGLFKKLVLADTLAIYADPMFFDVSNGFDPTFFEAWASVLCYTFQIYFDFSAYSDMAIGLAYLFGIRLPLNFYSPYKAVDIIDFWRRWHITLSEFLRDYLYKALGGNRKSSYRKYTNIFLTMLIGGIWHGAGWNFMVWGLLHGGYVCVAHFWKSIRRRYGLPGIPYYLSVLMTFLCVSMAWVFFRAPDMDTAMRVLEGLGGLNGFALSPIYGIVLGPIEPVLSAMGWRFDYYPPHFAGIEVVLLIGLCIIICLLLPSTYEVFNEKNIIFRKPDNMTENQSSTIGLNAVKWNLTWAWALGLGIMAGLGVMFLFRVSPFLYFQF